MWTVGHRSGPDGDRPLVEHYDGYRWTVVRAADAANADGLLDAVTAAHGQAWVAGQTDDAAHRGRPLLGRVVGGRFVPEHRQGVPADRVNPTWPHPDGLIRPLR